MEKVSIQTPTLFGIGDGAKKIFDLFDLFDVSNKKIVSTNVNNVWQTDWQGRVALSNQPRTNLLVQPINYLDAWHFDKPASAVIVDVAAPDGSTPTILFTPSPTGNPPSVLYGNRFWIEVFKPNGDYDLSVSVRAQSITGPVTLYVVNANSDTVINHADAVSTLGWQRIAVSGTTNGSSAGVRFVISSSFPVYVWGCQAEAGNSMGVYIPTTTSPVTVTDYVNNLDGTLTLGQAPVQGAILEWSGSYEFNYASPSFETALQTVISQYQNSPTIMQLVKNMSTYIDPFADLDSFYSFVWNVQTAQGFGLDIWGKIVGVNRNLNVPVTPQNFGFNEGLDYYPLGQAPFYNGPQTGAYILSDAAYRTLIMVKALANISAATIPSYNQLLKNLFAGRGSCFVSDLGNMQIQYVFSFYLTPYEVSILTNGSVLPRPAGVLAQGVQIYQPDTFGFKEATGYQTFGNGTFALNPVPIH